MNKIVAVIQARMGSTRLPGKVLRPIYGRPLLDIQLERIRRCKTIDQIVVATSDNSGDDVIEQLCRLNKVSCVRGDESNVLSRFYNAAKHTDADVLIRLTGDCPLIDPEIIDEAVQYFLAHQYKYISNVHPRTYPRGMDVEVFSVDALNDAFKNAKSVYDLEHVTPYIIKNNERGSIVYLKNASEFRLTVDTPEDFEVIRLIFTALYPNNPAFTLDDILAYMSAHPSIGAINAHIEQKPLENG